MSQPQAGQLFPDGPPPRPTRPSYRVTVAGGAVVVRSANLPFALAQARALALSGRRCWLRDNAGGCVEVANGPAGLGLTSPSPPDPPWLGACRALLDDHT